MSSFTSSFKKERFPLLACLLLVLGAELGSRVLLPSVSVDARDLTELWTRIDGVRRTHSPRVVFLGNSTSRAGVDLTVVEGLLRKGGASKVSILKVVPDDSTLPDWYYLVRHLVNRKGFVPDVLVTGGIAQHIDDSALVHVDRIANSYGGLDNWTEISVNEVRSLDERLSFLVSSASVFYANRERFRNRILDLLIPHYGETANWINRQLRAKAAKKDAGKKSYVRLGRFLHLCKEQGILPVVVAMPVAAAYYVDPAMKHVVEDNGGVFVDLTRVPGLSASNFPDLLHMDHQGAELYSSALASVLVSDARIVAKLRRSEAR